MLKNGKCYTLCFNGINPFEILVEIQILPGIPLMSIVGLVGKAVTESKERIRSALYSTNFNLPNGRIVINLSPADQNKEGTHYDLAIALALLEATGYITLPKDTIVMGELSLDGKIIGVKGILPAAIFAQQNNKSIILPIDNYFEIPEIINIKKIAVKSLKEIVEILRNERHYISPVKIKNSLNNEEELEDLPPFYHIFGQEVGKRALTISAAGKHHLLFLGSHGIGKSTLAKAIQKLLPDLTYEESLESTSIYSIAGYAQNKLITRPPFRSPHSSTSLVGMVGGGCILPKPGEISLAHNGILFLDELPEFAQDVIDSLRGPLEEGEVSLVRLKYNVILPAKMHLIVAMNPCKCGFLLKGNCRCGKKNYIYRLSAPIMDRIDLHVLLSDVDFSDIKPDLSDPRPKIKNAILMQQNRYGNKRNSQVNINELKESFTPQALNKVIEICTKKNLSVRSLKKIYALSRTIADLDNSLLVHIIHVEEAFFYRLNLLEF